MKYIKAFDNQNKLETYDKSEWISPHIYLDKTNKTISYEQKYIRVEYIRSTQTGGQYIDLETCLFDTSPINLEIDMNWMLYGHGKTGIQQSTMLCASKEESSYPGLNIRTSNDNSGNVQCVIKEAQYKDWCFSRGTGKYETNIFSADWDSVAGTGYILRSKDHLKVDARNILQHFDLEFNFSDNQLHNVTTILFCSKDSSGTPWRFIDARLDYLKLYKRGVLIHNLVPVVNTNNIAGLYDIVNRKFLRSQGDEDFVAGPKLTVN